MWLQGFLKSLLWFHSRKISDVYRIVTIVILCWVPRGKIQLLLLPCYLASQVCLRGKRHSLLQAYTHTLSHTLRHINSRLQTHTHTLTLTLTRLFNWRWRNLTVLTAMSSRLTRDCLWGTLPRTPGPCYRDVWNHQSDLFMILLKTVICPYDKCWLRWWSPYYWPFAGKNLGLFATHDTFRRDMRQEMWMSIVDAMLGTAGTDTEDFCWERKYKLGQSID